jgi:hypothetical protein
MFRLRPWRSDDLPFNCRRLTALTNWIAVSFDLKTLDWTIGTDLAEGPSFLAVKHF